MASLEGSAVGRSFDLGKLLGPPIIYGSIPGENIYAEDEATGVLASPSLPRRTPSRLGIGSHTAGRAGLADEQDAHMAMASLGRPALPITPSSCNTPATMGISTEKDLRESPPPTGPVHAGVRRAGSSYIGGVSNSLKWKPQLGEQVMILEQKKGQPFRRRDIATVLKANKDGTFDLMYVIGRKRIRGLKKNEDFENFVPCQGKTRSQARAPWRK